ncbi:MAG: nucleotidyltransferase family protein [Planctomycetes bacterium]|nr:nucleotidyltransferase family protein [Planctomycetota bacterium]
MSEIPVEVHAIIPAAGFSRRMGRDKQLIEIDGRPMLLSIVNTLIEAGLSRVMVVTRRAIAESLSLPHHDHVQISYNEDATSEMIDSIRIGLDALAHTVDVKPTGYLVCPGDLPRLSTDDVRACLDAFSKNANRIIIASHSGRRGHPLIFPASLSVFVHSPTCDLGLNAICLVHADTLLLVPCASDGILIDADRPDDLPPKAR